MSLLVTLFVSLAFECRATAEELLIAHEAALTLEEFGDLWFDRAVWDSTRRIPINYDINDNGNARAHIIQKCMSMNDDDDVLCLCKKPFDSNLYSCHHAEQDSDREEAAHQSASEAMGWNWDWDDDSYPMSFNLDRGVNLQRVKQMEDRLDENPNLFRVIAFEFGWLFEQSRNGNSRVFAAKEKEIDALNAVQLGVEQAFFQWKRYSEQIDTMAEKWKAAHPKEMQEIHKQQMPAVKGVFLESYMNADKDLKWEEKVKHLDALKKEWRRLENSASAKRKQITNEYQATLNQLRQPGIKKFVEAKNGNTVLEAYMSDANIDKWSLSRTEITLLYFYVMDDMVASTIRKYWRDGTLLASTYSLLRDMFYRVTHLPHAAKVFLPSIKVEAPKPAPQHTYYLVLWFGMRDVEYPVHGKRVGEALGDATTLRGIWSVSTKSYIADKYAGCPGPRTAYLTAGVVFRIKVPYTEIGNIHGIDAEWFSTEKQHQDKSHEVILYDIPGKYVYVWKHCTETGQVTASPVAF